MTDINELLLATGARIGEVLAPRWEDVQIGVDSRQRRELRPEGY